MTKCDLFQVRLNKKKNRCNIHNDSVIMYASSFLRHKWWKDQGQQKVNEIVQHCG